MRGRTEEPRPRRHNRGVGIMEQPVKDLVVFDVGGHGRPLGGCGGPRLGSAGAGCRRR
jgi:hypothetical protein